MNKILVSLISEQTIPNVLLIRELKGIERHIFITTKKMEDGKKCRSDWIIKATGLDSTHVQRIIVNQDSLDDIEAKLTAQVKKCEETSFVVNLTGGNKLMSLAAYNFFRHLENSEIFYIPVGPKMVNYEGIFPQNIRQRREIKHRSNLKEYLTSYGVKPKAESSPLKSEKDTQTLFSVYQGLDSTQLELLHKLREKRSKGVKQISKEAELEELLGTLGFTPSESEKLSKHEVKYLTGDWFEEYIYALIKDVLFLNDSQIWTGIPVDINGQENELDVLFIIDNKLYLVECKTSVFDDQTDRNIFTETAYKSAALRREFGLNVETMIFTLTLCGKARDNIREIEKERAKLLGIRYIFDGTLLADKTELEKSLKRIFHE